MLSIYQIFGIIGIVLLVAAWVWEAFEKKISIHKHFAILYIIGISILTVYSWKIKDAIFFWLNTILLVAIILEFVYSLKR